MFKIATLFLALLVWTEGFAGQKPAYEKLDVDLSHMDLQVLYDASLLPLKAKIANANPRDLDRAKENAAIHKREMGEKLRPSLKEVGVENDDTFTFTSEGTNFYYYFHNDTGLGDITVNSVLVRVEPDFTGLVKKYSVEHGQMTLHKRTLKELFEAQKRRHQAFNRGENRNFEAAQQRIDRFQSPLVAAIRKQLAPYGVTETSLMIELATLRENQVRMNFQAIGDVSQVVVTLTGMDDAFGFTCQLIKAKK